MTASGWATRRPKSWAGNNNGTGLSRGSIYRMACERKWRRYRVDRTVYYHPDDVFGKKAT